jgi:hypothetical protein
MNTLGVHSFNQISLNYTNIIHGGSPCPLSIISVPMHVSTYVDGIVNSRGV